MPRYGLALIFFTNSRRKALAFDRRLRVVTIYGGGGQGKTALAREAIERFAHAWPGGVYAISLDTLLSLPTFVTGLARFLHIDTTDTLDVQEIASRIAARLAQHRTLVVLDNAETLVEAVERNEVTAIQLGQFLQQLPSSTVSLLVTSRWQLGWAGEQSIELQGLSPAEGTDLFTEHAPQRAQEIDRALAWSLSEQVEGHPLSLRLLGSVFNNAGHLALPDFIATYEDELVKAENKYRDLDHRQRTLYADTGTAPLGGG